MADFDVNIVLRARDEARGVVRGLKGELAGLPGPLGGRGRGRADGQLFRASNLASAASGVNQLTNMAKGALGTPLELAANFEQGMAEVRAVTSDALLADNFDALTKKARELGATTEFTAQEVASGLKFMGVAGFDTQKQLSTIAPLLDAATVSGADLGKVSDVVTDVMGGFGMGADEATRAVDSMVTTTLSANTNLLQLGRGLFKVAPLAKKAGIDINEVNAMLGVLANAGIKGAEGGTVMRNMLLSVTGKPTKDMRKALRQMGLDSAKLRKILDKDGLEGALAAINKQFHTLNPSQQLFAANVMFGRRTAAGATEVLSQLTGGYADLKTKLDASNGTAAETAKQFRSTAKASAKELKSALEETGIVVGEALLPVLRPMLEDAKEAARSFAEWAKKNPELVQTLGKILIGVVAVGSVLGPVLLTLSSLHSVIGLASGSGRVFAAVLKSQMVANMMTATTESVKLGGSLKSLAGQPGGKLGIFGAATAAFAVGYAFGTWLDSTFGISDAISGINTEMSIHNQLLKEELGLQVGLSKFRGAAKLGSLTEGERKKLKAAQERKEALSKELADFEESQGFDATDLVSPVLAAQNFLDRKEKREAITNRIQAAQAEIDRLNKTGREREIAADQATAKGETAKALEVANAQSAALAGGGGKGTVKIIVADDRKIRAEIVDQDDINLAMENGITTEGM